MHSLADHTPHHKQLSHSASTELKTPKVSPKTVSTWGQMFSTSVVSKKPIGAQTVGYRERDMYSQFTRREFPSYSPVTHKHYKCSFMLYVSTFTFHTI